MIRLYAILGVIFIHTAYSGYALFVKEPQGTHVYWIHMLVSVISKAASPLFFAISGAVLLKKKEPVLKIWKTRIPRILVCLIFFSAVYYVIITADKGEEASISGFLLALYQGNVTSHLWYLYAYISLLILLPFMRPMVQNMKKEHFYYLYAAALFTGPIAGLTQFLAGDGNVTLESHASLSMLRTSFILYPILGYFIEHRLAPEERRRLIPAAFLLSIILTAAVCFATNRLITAAQTTEIEQAEKFFGMASFALVPFIYMVFQEIAQLPCPKFISNAVLELASGTMGVYLIHIFIMRYSPATKMLTGLQRRYGIGLCSGFLYTLAVFTLSICISFIWGKMPVLRCLIGCSPQPGRRYQLSADPVQ